MIGSITKTLYWNKHTKALKVERRKWTVQRLQYLRNNTAVHSLDFLLPPILTSWGAIEPPTCNCQQAQTKASRKVCSSRKRSRKTMVWQHSPAANFQWKSPPPSMILGVGEQGELFFHPPPHESKLCSTYPPGYCYQGLMVRLASTHTCSRECNNAVWGETCHHYASSTRSHPSVSGA